MIDFSKVKGLSISRVPSGYTQVEYIESSGTQYIDTGVPLTPTMGVKAKIRSLSVAPVSNLFGTQDVSSSPVAYFNIGYNQNSQLYAEWGNGHQVIIDTAPTAPQDYEIEFNYKNSGKLVVNGVTYASGIVIERGSNCNLYICADNLVWDTTSTSDPDRFGEVQVESFVITDGVTVVRDFVSVIKSEKTDILPLAVHQHWISKEGVTSGQDANWISSDKIPVAAGDVVRFGLQEHVLVGSVVAYNSNGEVVGYISSPSSALNTLFESTYTIPDGATHITITGGSEISTSVASRQYAYLITAKDAGLYDLVESKLHGNAGSGEFAAGQRTGGVVTQIVDVAGNVLWKQAPSGANVTITKTKTGYEDIRAGGYVTIDGVNYNTELTSIVVPLGTVIVCVAPGTTHSMYGKFGGQITLNGTVVTATGSANRYEYTVNGDVQIEIKNVGSPNGVFSNINITEL